MREQLLFFFGICENKCTYQRLCFQYIDSTIISSFSIRVQASGHLLWPVGNPEEKFYESEYMTESVGETGAG